MPSVKSHHVMLLNDYVGEPPMAEYDDINQLVAQITFNILTESPDMVVDISQGNTDSSALEKAIIKDIDKHKYHYGLKREDLIKRVFDYMFGYGVLQRYIEDEDISDIDGTRYNEFSIKRNGVRTGIYVDFGSEKAFETYCKLIAIRNGGILNENDSYCRITDDKRRLRINLAIRPRNVSGPSISIRKHRLKSYTLDDLERLQMLNREVRQILNEYIIEQRLSMVISGKGGAGKTTLLRAIINALPVMERVLITETDAEIFPDKPYCIQQRIKKANEGGIPVTLRDLVRDGLTMSLDTYCVGELIGGEACDFVKCCFTGHRGLATTHSESAEDTLTRLLTLCNSADHTDSERTLKEMMARGINIVCYLRDFKVTDIIRVKGYDGERDSFAYEYLYRGNY